MIKAAVYTLSCDSSWCSTSGEYK